MGQKWDNLRPRIARHVDQLRQFAHLVLICAAVMFVLCIALSWILENTDLLAVASRRLPVAPGAVDRETFNAAAAVQSLDTLTAGLPVLIILLITAGALHPAHSGYQMTEVGQPLTNRNARHADHRSVHRGEEGHHDRTSHAPQSRHQAAEADQPRPTPVPDDHHRWPLGPAGVAPDHALAQIRAAQAHGHYLPVAMSYQQPQTNPAPAKSRSPLPWLIGVVAVVVAVCVSVLIMHSRTSQPPAPAATPACSTVFKLGAPVTAADATIACTNRLGYVSRSHSMPCKDGRTMVFDRDADVYGFAGGVFDLQDVDASSQYAKDFYACVG